MTYDLKSTQLEVSSGLSDDTYFFGAKLGVSDAQPEPIKGIAVWAYTLAKMTANAAAVLSAIGAYSSAQVDTLLAAKANTSSLAAVATSGSASDLASGTLPAARLPVPGATTLGGVKSASAGSHQFMTGIDASGNPTFAQPAASDISGLSLMWSAITGTPTTVAGYGITDAYTKTQADGRYAQIAATLAGYGITDAYTKTQVDSIVQGLNPKAVVLVATTANITLSGTQTIDGVAVTVGTRVLVKNQTTASQNGIYVVAAGAWTRSTDMNSWANVPGAYVFAEQGTLNADCGFVCTSDPGGTLESTAITWVQFAGAGTYTAGAGLALNGTQFSFATISNNTLLGNISGSAAVPIALTATQIKGMLAISTSDVSGLGSFATISSLAFSSLTGKPTTLSGYGITDGASLGANTFTGAQVVSSASFGLSGNISAPAWTTSGIRYKNQPATLTDTTSSGTVAAAYTDLFGGNTIAANNVTTFTDYFTIYVNGPNAGTNVTFTNAWALGLGGDLKGVGATFSGTVNAGTFSGGLAFSNLTSVPTTLAGHGITDAYTKTASDARYLQIANNLSDVVAATARSNLGLGTFATISSLAFSSLTSIPTTFTGYSFTGAQTLALGTVNGTGLAITQTWGGTGTYTGIQYNVTDSGPANAASLLLDLQVGGQTQFNVTKDGAINVYASVANAIKLSLRGTAIITANASNTLLNSNSLSLGASADTYLSRPSAATWQHGAADTNTTSTAVTSIANGSPGTITVSLPALSVGTPVKLTTTGTLPTGYTAGTQYYVLTNTGTAITLSTSIGGSAVNTSSAGSGTHSIVYGPIAQYTRRQGAITGTDIAGAPCYWDASPGTGAGAPGVHIFRVPTILGSGTTQQSLATAMTINADKSITLAGSVSIPYTANFSGYPNFAFGGSLTAGVGAIFKGGNTQYGVFWGNGDYTGAQVAGLVNPATGVVKVLGGGTVSSTLQFDPKTFANLPTGAEGMVSSITDCNTNTAGASAAGGGSYKALVTYQNGAWRVIGGF